MRRPRSKFVLLPSVPSAFVAIACASFVLGEVRSAHAEGTFDGQWRQGPMREDYTVQQWFGGCGPAPVSGSQGGGETVNLRTEGDELVFSGGGRTWRTNQCYDPMPTLAREAHSRDASGRSWRTRCTTPPGDPRKALMQTLVAASTDKRIDVIETGRYEVTIAEGRCVADVKRTRSFELIALANGASQTPPPAPTAVASTSAKPAATHDPRCDTPGEPARLEARPSRKLLRPGESFTFSASVRDANGCPTRTETSWSLVGNAEAAGLKVDPSGRVTASDTALEGAFELLVNARGKSAKVTVEVASSANYDALLAKGGLNAAGESDVATVTIITTGSIGSDGTRVEEQGKKSRTVFIAIVSLSAVLLGALALVGVRRSRRAAAVARDAEERHASKLREFEEMRRQKVADHDRQMKEHMESVANARDAAIARAMTRPMICPACRREFESGSTFCPHDGSTLVADGSVELQGTTGMVCPACRRGYPPGTTTCTADREALVPYAMLAASPTSEKRKKICPVCGSRFEGSAEFCGKDGASLVLLN